MQAEDLSSNAEKTGAYLRDGLERLAAETGAIVEVRGRGLMLAAQLAEPKAAKIAAAALDRDFVLNNIGPDILRFLPPLVCSEGDVDALLSMLSELLAEEDTAQ